VEGQLLSYIKRLQHLLPQQFHASLLDQYEQYAYKKKEIDFPSLSSTCQESKEEGNLLKVPNVQGVISEFDGLSSYFLGSSEVVRDFDGFQGFAIFVPYSEAKVHGFVISHPESTCLVVNGKCLCGFFLYVKEDGNCQLSDFYYDASSVSGVEDLLSFWENVWISKNYSSRICVRYVNEEGTIMNTSLIRFNLWYRNLMVKRFLKWYNNPNNKEDVELFDSIMDTVRSDYELMKPAIEESLKKLRVKEQMEEEEGMITPTGPLSCTHVTTGE